MFKMIAGRVANNVDPDQTQYSVCSGLSVPLLRVIKAGIFFLNQNCIHCSCMAIYKYVLALIQIKYV